MRGRDAPANQPGIYPDSLCTPGCCICCPRSKTRGGKRCTCRRRRRAQGPCWVQARLECRTTPLPRYPLCPGLPSQTCICLRSLGRPHLHLMQISRRHPFIPTRELDQYQQGLLFPLGTVSCAHPNTDSVSLATGQWRAPSFHNSAVIRAFLNLALGPSSEPSTSTLFGHAGPPASAVAGLLPWLPRLIPAVLPVVEWSQQHRLPRLPHWAWCLMARKRGFSPLLSCQPMAAAVPQLTTVPPANALNTSAPPGTQRSPCIPALVLCRRWDGPGLSFPSYHSFSFWEDGCGALELTAQRCLCCAKQARKRLRLV